MDIFSIRQLDLRLLLGAAMLVGATEAAAVTLSDLRDQGLDPIFGDYAPGGDCVLEPRLTIGETGFAFQSGARTAQSESFEHALSFWGPDYDGISLVFFPFPLDEYEPGHVLMIVNADEQPGIVTFDENLGPGESLSPLEAELIAASPLMMCRSDPAGQL